MQRIFLTMCIALPAVLCLSTGLRRGSCPPTLPVNQCEAECGPQSECVSPQLCCPTSCGGSMCVDSVTQRRFTNLVKKGHCPGRPGGTWVCTHTCTGDSDCRDQLKCCTNRCGALTCIKPELDF